MSRPSPGASQSACLPPPKWRFSGLCAESLRVGPRGGCVDASCPAPVRGCGYRSRATRLSVPEPLRDRHGPARARPGLWWNAISRMSPPQAGHSSGNSSPTRAISFAQASSRRVMRAGLCLSVAAASGAVTVVSVPANRGLALRADPGTQTARVRPSRSRRAAWTCARGRGRPSWPLFVAGARSGCGRRRRGSRRAVPGRMAAGRSTAAGVREADTRHALGAVRA